MNLNNLQDLYVEQLEDIYDAEQQLIRALPQMAQAATSPNLKNALVQHYQQTKSHIQRLQQVFDLQNTDPQTRTCKAMVGLISEASQTLKDASNPGVRDAGLIAEAQRIEHYEIAAYGTVRTFAHSLDRQQEAQLLQETLNEEGDTDKLLTVIATTLVNQSANTEKAH